MEGPLAKSAAYRDTVGSRAYLEGIAPLRVSGYGLVIGLGGNGSRECPKPILEHLLQSLHRNHKFTTEDIGPRRASPEELIESLDTAAVVVHGDLPAAATAGTSFDLFVQALPGSQTRSLSGGRLILTELEAVHDTGAGARSTGRVVAKACGPVFINPFSSPDSPTRSPQGQGTILGGGTTTEDRAIRLVLTQPSYPWVRRIQDRLNVRFPEDQPVARAASPSFVNLRVPAGYRRDPGRFLALVPCLFLFTDPAAEAVRLRELVAELPDPSAPKALISLALEGIGRSALPVLDSLYAHPDQEVRFHAALAGLRLGDHLAGDVMALMTADAGCPERYAAIRALGEADGMASAGHALRQLMADSDPRVRVAAYEALVGRRDPMIERRVVGEDAFVLDVIPVGESLIHVRRTRERRIALFGPDLKCEPPLLYRSPDGILTITAEEDDEQLSLMRTVATTGTVSPPIPAPLGLKELMLLLGGPPGMTHRGQVTGLGLDYGAVVRTLHELSAQGFVRAPFLMEQPNAAELFGPGETVGRPESEL